MKHFLIIILRFHLVLAVILVSSGLLLSQKILFIENFDDTDLASRGWYDGPKGKISTTEHISGSTGCFECTFLKGQRSCAEGIPGRHLFDETDEMYVSYWVKYSSNWEGSNKPYHPHEINIMTNADDKYVGPAITHLTMYIEQNEGRPLLALQDSKNVDQNCILQNNNGFIGCNGDINSYQFTENRSVAACNGIVGGYDRRDCFYYGSGYYYSARIWDMDSAYFTDTKGTHYKNDWHHIEVYFRMNTIESGKGIPNGKIRYWYDSELLINYDDILMRTAQFPDMKFNQFLIAPYIGDGSPIDQTFWIDNLTVATSPLNSEIRKTNDREFYLSPNPASDYIEINIPVGVQLAVPMKVEMYSIEGILMQSTSPQPSPFLERAIQIDVSAFVPGVYFVKIGDRVQRFVKM